VAEGHVAAAEPLASVPTLSVPAVSVPTVSVIVPFHRGLAMLERVIDGIHASDLSLEIVIVANGHVEPLDTLADRRDVRVIALPSACGPAMARNRGAEQAAAPVLVFIDADVVPHPAAIPAMLAVLSREPDVSAVFGAYDHAPAHPSFYSQYRNLAHAFVHEQASPEASTFWAGLGAVRAAAFHAVGGFDERFVRPSIEDIDLGYRLKASGRGLRLDVAARGTHLRGWTFASSLVTDVRDRGVPWTQALLKYGAVANDLNVSSRGRWSVACVYVAVVGAAASLLYAPMIAVALIGAAGFVATQQPMLRWFAVRRGALFAAGVLAGQAVHHVCNGLSLLVGTALWTGQRAVGVRTAWTLADDPWRAQAPRQPTGHG
jgi:GT2 family glycosyltransferase